MAYGAVTYIEDGIAKVGIWGSDIDRGDIGRVGIWRSDIHIRLAEGELAYGAVTYT